MSKAEDGEQADLPPAARRPSSPLPLQPLRERQLRLPRPGRTVARPQRGGRGGGGSGPHHHPRLVGGEPRTRHGDLAPPGGQPPNFQQRPPGGQAGHHSKPGPDAGRHTGPRGPVESEP